jgi:hypothetical protein
MGEVDAGNGAETENDGGQQISSVDAGPVATTGLFNLITYNVAALPQALSGSDPADNIPLIGPLLSDYDLVLVQEDFWYHDELAAGITLPHHSDPSVTEPTLLPPNLGDGLNRFSIFPIGTMDRNPWEECNGLAACATDCQADKGFTRSSLQLATGVVLDVYNVHFDAGSCEADFEAREAQAQQLIDAVNAQSADRAVIVAGDTNLRLTRPPDDTILNNLLTSLSLKVACREAECGQETIDRILFRSGNDMSLHLESWTRPDHFVAPSGDPLSDHEPTTAVFSWER